LNVGFSSGTRRKTFSYDGKEYRTQHAVLTAVRKSLPAGSPLLEVDDATLLRKFVSSFNEWKGGTESNVFTKLERIAASAEPKTPTLGCTMNSTLLSRHDHKNQVCASFVCLFDCLIVRLFEIV